MKPLEEVREEIAATIAREPLCKTFEELADQILAIQVGEQAMKCRSCNGSGSWPGIGFDRKKCPYCEGGTIKVPLTLADLISGK